MLGEPRPDDELEGMLLLEPKLQTVNNFLFAFFSSCSKVEIYWIWVTFQTLCSSSMRLEQNQFPRHCFDSACCPETKTSKRGHPCSLSAASGVSDFAVKGAADKNPNINPDIEDERVPQPLGHISLQHRQGREEQGGGWETCQEAISAALCTRRQN